MAPQREEFTEIQKLLKMHPQGMSVTEIARAMGKNKHSTGRYLDSMYASGQVDMRTVGMAKIYTLAHRLPLSSLISGMREKIMILDEDFRIILINDGLAELIDYTQDEVAGRDIRHLPVHDPEVHDLFVVVAARLKESEEVFEHSLDQLSGGTTHLHIHIIPSQDEMHHAVYVIVMVDISDHVRMVHELRERERQYRELVEMADAIILKLDINGNILFFNEFAETFFGYAKEEVLGRNVIGTIVPPTDMTGKDLREMIHLICTRTEQFSWNENANITKAGDLVWVRWSNRAMKDEDGRVVGILSVGNDITDRKQMEMELIDQKNELERRVKELECIHQFSGVVGSNFSREELLFSIVRVIGDCWSRRGAMGIRIRFWDEVYENGSPDGLLISFRKPILSGGRPAGMLEVGFSERNEKEEYYQDKERLLSLFAERIGWAIDWMEAEAEIRRARDLSDTLLATVDAAIFVLDSEGRIVRFNRRSEELTGYLAEEVFGRYIWDMFILPEMREGVRSYIAVLSETKRKARIRGKWIAKDGTWKMVDWSNTVICDDEGVVTHIISTGIDVTRQLEDEEELRRCRSVLDRLLAGVKNG
jgi:PAS domain S-box-containing protein